MKYTMVRQFSNNALDNIFKFGFKIVDFSKLLLDTMISFLDIWYTFLMIFYNLLLYVYYLFLYLIDRSSESNATFMFKRTFTSASYNPKVTITEGANPIPAMYGAAQGLVEGTAKVASSVASTTTSATSKAVSTASDVAKSAISSMSTPASSMSKKSIIKSIGEAIVEFFITLKRLILAPFKGLINLFDRRVKPAKKDGKQSKSLIEEYMREYEENRS